MTLPKERQASHKVEKEQLIQDIRKFNPDITEKQLDKYDIDDLSSFSLPIILNNPMGFEIETFQDICLSINHFVQS